MNPTGYFAEELLKIAMPSATPIIPTSAASVTAKSGNSLPTHMTAPKPLKVTTPSVGKSGALKNTPTAGGAVGAGIVNPALKNKTAPTISLGGWGKSPSSSGSRVR